MTVRFPILILYLLLAGCDSEPSEPAQAPRDPQVAQALDDPLMTDPDLSSRNEGAAALTVESDGSLPVLPANPESLEAARAEAAALVGGADRLVAPPSASGSAPELHGDGLAAQLSLLPGWERCEGKLDRSAIWAARFPAILPIYPRGSTLAAAGSNEPSCRARTAIFTTPVPLTEVLAFYWTRSSVLQRDHRKLGPVHVLSGAGGGLAFEIRASESDDRTLVRIATIER